MTAKIDYRDFTVAIKRLDEAPTQLQKELVDNLHEAAPKIEADMQAAAFTKIQRRAVSTVQITKDTEGITIKGGAGGGLGGELFAGGEFGGRKSKKKPYATRSPNGRAYVVSRRVTMQFLPHLGTEGYFFWPTMRDWLPKLFKQQQKTLENVMGGDKVMGTTVLDLKVTADAQAAVQGLKPLSASLDGVTQDAQKTESALKDLDKQHTIDLNDAAIVNARKEISRLRASIRDDLRLDVNANTKPAQRRVRELQSTIKSLSSETIEIKAEVDADVDSISGTTAGLSALIAQLKDMNSTSVDLDPDLINLRNSLGSLRGIATKAAGPLAAVGVAVGGWKLGEAAADVETMVTQLDALTSGKGAETFADIQKWAAATPFAIEDATEATKKLVAAGVPLQDVPDYLNDIGNVASATGVPIEQLGTVFAQMQSKGKATFEELQQIAEAGVPVWATLAEKLHLTTAEVQELASQGKLGADAIALARESLAELYPTAMQDQAETFNGQMSTLKDTFAQIGSELGETVLPFMSQLVGDFNDLAGGTLDLVRGLTDVVGKFHDLRQESAKSAQDGKSNFKDLLDIASQPGILSLGRAWQGVLELFGDEAPAEAMKETGKASDGLTAKVLAGMGAQTDAVMAGSEAAKAYEQALKDAFDSISGIGADVRTKVSFIIDQDDLKEEIARKIKGGKGEEGITLPANIKITDVAGLSDAQQGLITDVASLWQGALEEGSRRAELLPDFDLAGWLEKQRAGLAPILIKAGVDPANVEAVLADIVGADRSTVVKVSADVSAAQAAVDGIQMKPFFESLVPTLPPAPIVIPTTVAQPVFPPIPPPDVLIVPKTDVKPAGAALDAVAAKERASAIDALMGNDQATSGLDWIARDRFVTIHVNEVATGTTASGATGGGRSIVPQMFGSAETVAGLRGVSSQAMVATTTPVPNTKSLTRTGTVTQLAPRQVPIKIYLDGAEIADHLTLKAGRLAAASSVKRRA